MSILAGAGMALPLSATFIVRIGPALAPESKSSREGPIGANGFAEGAAFSTFLAASTYFSAAAFL